MTKISNRSETIFVGYAGTLLVLIGSVMPWVENSLISKSGTDGDGIFTLILGLLSLAIVANKKSWRYSSAIMGILITSISGWHIYDIKLRASELMYELVNNPFAELAEIKVGIGLYLVAFGGISLILYSSIQTKAKN